MEVVVITSHLLIQHVVIEVSLERGLIAYATKQCAYGDPTSVIDYDCHSRLISYTPLI